MDYVKSNANQTIDKHLKDKINNGIDDIVDG